MGATKIMAENIDIQKYLPKIKKVTTFRYLTDEECREIISLSEIIRYDPDETIIRQGDVSQHFYVLVEGTVSVSVRRQSGKEVEICTIGEGEVFGESAIFMTLKRTASILCATSAVVLRIHRKNMIAFFKKFPHAGNKILMLIIYSLLNKLRTANEELVYEKHSTINLDYIDTYVQEAMLEN